MNYRYDVWLLMLAMILLSACRSTPEVTATAVSTQAEAVRTAAAETAQARLDAMPSMTPMPPTPNPVEWTQTAEALASPTPNAAQPTAATLTPTAEGTQPTITQAAATGNDKASYVKDINIPDNTVIGRGASFTKTWQCLNNGSSNWTTAYEFVWVDGDQISTRGLRQAASGYTRRAIGRHLRQYGRPARKRHLQKLLADAQP